MIRPRSLLGAAAFLLMIGSGLFWMTRRTPGQPPQEDLRAPFRTEPATQGGLMVLEPPAAPLRGLRWVGPLPGRWAVSQILAQTGRQQAVLFQDGRLVTTATFEAPPEVTTTFFAFADLVDAAVIPDRTALLLYRGPGGGAAGLVIAWDLPSGSMRGALKAPGDRLVPAPDHRGAYLLGEGPELTLLRLSDGPTGKLRSTRMELPSEIGALSCILPLGPQAFVLAHARGMSLWRAGAWTHTPSPLASPLGFAPGGGTLAGGTREAWWQPEPGRLIPLRSDGLPGEAQDLASLLPAEAALDASLLRLLGMDEEGALWFGLSRPSLPASTPAPEPTAPAAEGSALLIQEPPGFPEVVTQADWTAHLQKGLDRIYCWKPGTPSMKTVAWNALWKRLSPPSGIAAPAGDGGLRPEAGALLLGPPDRVWWLPLASVQPR